MPEISHSKYLVQAGWGDVPHLDEQTKQDLLASTMPHLRDARTKGIPSLGAGAIYPIELSEVLCDPFQLPPYWPRAYALDVGWNCTAALWGAWDRSVDCVYLYTEHYRGQAEPSIHASAIKARGDWIPGLIDPAARGRSQKDGEQLIAQYREHGLNLREAENAVEAGIYEVWERLSTGRLKVFRTLQNWQAEYRLYRRDEKGRIVKEFDHLMDCFHPDTLVWTDQGKFAIRDLPETGRVLTVGGEYAPYQNCGIVSRDAPVVRVTFSDGSTVTCTPDHLFLTPDGWVRADALQGCACYDAVSNSIQQVNSCASLSFPRPSRNFRASGTISAANTSSAKGCDCIVSSGKRRTIVEYLTGIMSTTKTKTGPTTSRRTWNSCSAPSIYRTIIKDMLVHLHRLLSMLRGIGTRLTRGWHGIVSTMSATVPTRCTSMMSSFANNVVSPMCLASPGAIAFAPMPARALGGGPAASITRSARATSAGRPSGSAATRKLEHVAASALLHCVGVEPAGRSDVYCLEVPSTHAFAVGPNGLIAHNCTRYLAVSIRATAICMPIPSDRQVIGSANRGDPKAGI